MSACALDTVAEILDVLDTAADAQTVMAVELPLALLQKIASCIPSLASLSHIATTSTALSEFVATNETLWDRL